MFFFVFVITIHQLSFSRGMKAHSFCSDIFTQWYLLTARAKRTLLWSGWLGNTGSCKKTLSAQTDGNSRQYVHVYSATSLATINKQNRLHYIEAIMLNREVFMSRTYFQKSIWGESERKANQLQLRKGYLLLRCSFLSDPDHTAVIRT